MVNLGHVVRADVQRDAIDTLLQHQVTGLVFACMYHQEIEPPATLPDSTVFLNCRARSGPFRSIIPAEQDAAAAAVRVLLEAGHRRIGYLDDTDAPWRPGSGSRATSARCGSTTSLLTLACTWSAEAPSSATAVSPELVEAVRVRLARTGVEPSAAHVAVALRAERAVLGDAEILAVARVLCADLIGAGPLEPLLAEAEVTDVLVNGPREVWVDDGHGLRLTSVVFPGEDALRRLAQRLASAAGRRLDDACPYVDARLAGGVRLHAVLPPVAPGGTCLSLRLPPRRTFTLPDLVEAGTIRADSVPVLTAVVESRLAFLVTGGTGTGKPVH